MSKSVWPNARQHTSTTAGLILIIDYVSACLSWSCTMKQADPSSIDQGGGKRRGMIEIFNSHDLTPTIFCFATRYHSAETPGRSCI